MRVVGGKLRGRPLSGPKNRAIRPTADRTRENLFNLLANLIDLTGIRVIDLFAGTGALGIEALSRGASFALFVETSAQGRALLRHNLESLELQGMARVFRRDATRLGERGPFPPFDLAFADPPYGQGLGARAASSLAAGGWLTSGALLVLEEDAATPPDPPAPFTLIDQRGYGDTILTIWRFGRPVAGMEDG